MFIKAFLLNGLMDEIEVLRKIFDEKIISIIDLFLSNSERKFSLSEVSEESRVNITTTLRVLDKLVKNEIIEITLIGKSKFYKQKQSEKTIYLSKILKKEDHLSEFIDRVKSNLKVKKIILETKTSNSAKILIVGDSISKEKLNRLIDEIKNKHNFRIQYVEMPEKQYQDLQNLGLFDISKKVIWERS